MHVSDLYFWRWFGRKDKTVKSDKFTDVETFYSEVRAGLREKADSNKRESEWMFILSIAATLVAPLFVTLGPGEFWGKAVPATLSVFAAGATAWLQVRKPQRLWSLYRRAQRQLEREKQRYDFGLADYVDKATSHQLFATKVSDIAYEVHEQWEGLVPEVDNLVAAKVSSGPEKRDEA